MEQRELGNKYCGIFLLTGLGHTGTRSLKVDVTSYTDGDAKWYFNALSVSPATTISFPIGTSQT